MRSAAEADLKRARRLARAFDTAFRIPGTRIRLGWDALLGLVPAIGDTLALAPFAYYVTVAIRHRLGVGICLRMAGNQGLDWLIGLVPLLGDLLDIGFKANVRNARLLEERLVERSKAEGAAGGID